MKKFIKLFILFFLFSCAKKEIVVTPEVVNNLIIDEKSARIDNDQIDLVLSLAQDDSLTIKGIVEDELNDSNIDNSIEFNLNQDVIEPQTSIIKELDYDKLFPDSIWTSYMTKRGDYLSLIAYKEYNNANEWR